MPSPQRARPFEIVEVDALLEARARVVNRGKSMVYLECDVVIIPEEKLVAKTSSTYMILRGEMAKGR